MKPPRYPQYCVYFAVELVPLRRHQSAGVKPFGIFDRLVPAAHGDGGRGVEEGLTSQFCEQAANGSRLTSTAPCVP
jgi:hypothetical protein